jgi:hypothetical protein
MPLLKQNPSWRSGLPGLATTNCNGAPGGHRPTLLSMRPQTGMSVLQSAAHEKTTHCPLHTDHCPACRGSYTFTAKRYTFPVHVDEYETRPNHVRVREQERERLCHYSSRTRAGAQGSQCSATTHQQSPGRRPQTGMSVLQSAAHEKTTHCPLHTDHCPACLIDIAYTRKYTLPFNYRANRTKGV